MRHWRYLVSTSLAVHGPYAANRIRSGSVDRSPQIVQQTRPVRDAGAMFTYLSGVALVTSLRVV